MVLAELASAGVSVSCTSGLMWRGSVSPGIYAIARKGSILRVSFHPPVSEGLDVRSIAYSTHSNFLATPAARERPGHEPGVAFRIFGHSIRLALLVDAIARDYAHSLAKSPGVEQKHKWVEKSGPGLAG